MQKIYPLLIICLLSFSSLLTTTTSAQEKAKENSNTQQAMLATEFVNQLNLKDYVSARKNFDKKMTSALDAKNLQKTWETLNLQAGNFQEILHTQSEEKGGYVRVTASSQFKNAIIDIITVFNTEKEIAGLFFKPSNFKPGEASSKKSISAPSSEYWTEEVIEFGDEEWRLSGTITYPKNNKENAIVILVHGSGPQDQDSTIGPNKPFRDIAHELAKQGIASLRYDKRTKVHGIKMSEKISEVTTYVETIDDVHHAVNFVKNLRNNFKPEKILVLGHSLGGMLIPRIAEQGQDITGYIMLAAPARPMEDLILEQYTYILGLDGEINTDEREMLSTIETQVKKVKTLSKESNVAAKDLPLGLHQNYWLDLSSYNMLDSVTKIEKPLLITQGARDYQVLADKDFTLWKDKLISKDNVTFKLYPKLNHLMISGINASSPEEYNVAAQVDKAFILDLAKWIKNQ